MHILARHTIVKCGAIGVIIWIIMSRITIRVTIFHFKWALTLAFMIFCDT